MSQPLCLVEIGIGPRGVAFGLPGVAAIVKGVGIFGIKADDSIVIDDGVVVVAFSLKSESLRLK